MKHSFTLPALLSHSDGYETTSSKKAPGAQANGNDSQKPDAAECASQTYRNCEELQLFDITRSNSADQVEWLVPNLWPRGGIGFIAGAPKAGKSWLAYDLAVSVATGTDFLGRPAMTPGRVFLFAGEESSAQIWARIRQLLGARGLDEGAISDRLFVSDLAPCLEDDEARARIVEAVRERKPDLVIFDPYARFLREAEENSATDLRTIHNWLRHGLSRATGAAVCITHHTSKEAGDLRGSSDIRALSEVTLFLKESRKRGELTVSFEMRHLRRPDPLVIRLVDSGATVNWEVIEESEDLVGRARKLLDAAGPDGITLEAAREKLKIRSDRTKAAIIEAGGVQHEGKGRWYSAAHLSRSAGSPDLKASGEGKGTTKARLPGTGTAGKAVPFGPSQMPTNLLPGKRDGAGRVPLRSFLPPGALSKEGPGMEDHEGAAE